MSRAFVKEPDGDETAGELPELPLSPHPNYVTPPGLEALKARQRALQSERAALSGAGGSIAATPALARLARELRYLEARIGSAILVDPAAQPADRAGFGALVQVEDEDGRIREFQIVGETPFLSFDDNQQPGSEPFFYEVKAIDACGVEDDD